MLRVAGGDVLRYYKKVISGAGERQASSKMTDC
jgi:hypothetical protein